MEVDIMAEYRKRRPYPTAAQKARLVLRLESDTDLSNGKYSSSFSKNEAERRWNDIADELNSIPGVVKTWIEWRKTWQDMKCSSKRKKNPKPKVPEPMPLMDEDFGTFSQDSSNSNDDRPEAPVAEEQPSGPKLLIELEGNGNTVSVSCTKKEHIPEDSVTVQPHANLFCRSTYLNNRRYTYDYFTQENICRLCWSTTNNMKCLEDDTATAQKILDYIGVNVITGTPNTVCTLCLLKIDSFIKFKKLCLEADRKLKILLSSDQCKVKMENDALICKKESESRLKHDRKVNIKQEQSSSDFDADDDLPIDDLYCSECNLNFDSADLMAKHKSDVHFSNESLYECYGCNKSFKKLKLCKDTMEYSCSSCCKCLSSKKLENSAKGKKCEVQKEKVYKCHSCQEVFKVHLDWRRHMAKHRKEMKFVCETCGRVLKNKKGLSEHMLIHTSNKQLKCPHCDYRATLKTSLVYHIRLHTGERPYACDKCPYTCVTSSNLRRHINTTHLGIKAFKCQICGKEYMYKRSLKEHITSTHQGKKENMCKRCGALYFRFEHLRKHILIKHRKVIKKVKDDYFEVNDAGYRRMSKYKMAQMNPSGT